MLRLLKGTGPGVILVTIALAAFFWMGSFIYSGNYVFNSSTYSLPVNHVLISLVGSSETIYLIISLGWVLLIASLLVSFNTGSFFIKERTFLPATLYILISSLFPYLNVFNPVLPAIVLLILAIMRIADSYRQPGISYNYFGSALMISTGSLFYPNMIWFGLILFVGMLLLRNINIREILISVFGLLVPYAILYGIYYVKGGSLSELTSLIGSSLFNESSSYEFSRLMIVILIFLGTTFLVSLVHLTSVFNSKKVHSRKIFSLLIWVMLISVAVFIFVPSASVEVFSIFLVPASYIFSNYYTSRHQKQIVPELMFSGTVVVIITLQMFRLFNLSF